MRTISILTTGLALLLAGAAHAETIEYRAVLSGANEVPPHDSPASGEAIVTYDTDTHKLDWSVTYSGLAAPLIGAHFHGPATAGANAGVLVPMTASPSPISGSAELSEEQAQFLRDGAIYVNLHTEKFPGGELRGNLSPQ